MEMTQLNVAAVPIGLNFTTAAVAANAVGNIIPPSLNLNGITIRTLSVSVNGGSTGGGVNIVADTSAPTSVIDLTKRSILELSVPAGGINSAGIPYPLYLYPGMGLWAGNTSENANISVTYDLVNPA
jgi:hypothetical protein